MWLLKVIYEKCKGEKAPYYYNYTILTIICKPIRKFVSQVIVPNCPFNNIRVCLYRLCGFKIGKHTFIGMKCYLDDMCYDLIEIGNNVDISYGVYFACHGKGQCHMPIIIDDGAYIGMRASIISKNTQNSTGGIHVNKNAIVGACTLVNQDIPEGATAVGIPCRIIHSADTLKARC
jgi:acetyltransferase-like isoleucine patch superfamily enzyme